MNYEDLIANRRIRPEQISSEEVKEAMKRADRDIRTASKVMPEDSDWAFSITYDAVLQASRAYMFAQGVRPASKEAHKNVFLFMKLSLDRDMQDIVSYFDRARVKRNKAIYDVAGLISETEAQNLFEQATLFLAYIKKQLDVCE